jgi:hypothetical protein
MSLIETANMHTTPMSFIEHIIEPDKLLLVWQSPNEEHPRTRFVVGELDRDNENVSLTYLIDSKDFIEAKKLGFTGYPAFQDTIKIHTNVLDALMRRLPPKTRGDFDLYLQGLRLQPNNNLSNFGLLGYSGARLPSDEFSIVHPFYGVEQECELLIEVAGFRYLYKDHNDIQIKEPISFKLVECYVKTQAPALLIFTGQKHIGYVTRALVPTFIDWAKSNRIVSAWVEKVNGTPGRPSVYVFVNVSSKKN